MPTKPKPSLSWAIANAKTFRRSPKGGFVAGFDSFTKGVTYSEGEFNALDSRYLSVYKALKTYKHLQPLGLNPSTTRHLFRMSQLYWTTAEPKLFTHTEISERFLMSVVAVINADVSASKSALLQVESFEVVTLPDGTKFGNNWLKNHYANIKHEQLELWYPGCVQKMHAAIDMVVTAKEAAELIFTQGFKVETQALPEDFILDGDFA